MTFEAFSDEEKAAFLARKAEYEQLYPRPKPHKVVWWRLAIVVVGFIVAYQIIAKLAWLALSAMFGMGTGVIIGYLLGCFIVAPLGGFFAARLSQGWTSKKAE